MYDETDKTELIKKLFDKKIVSILQIFFDDDSKQYYLREISMLAKVSSASTFRILKKLLKLKILKLNDYKTAKLYSLNNNNEVEFLKTIFKPDLLNNFLNQIKDIKEIEEIYLYGKREKHKATLFIIGEQIDKTKIKQKINELREKNFNIMDNYFTKEQFTQIENLFSESKKLLYKKEN